MLAAPKHGPSAEMKVTWLTPFARKGASPSSLALRTPITSHVRPVPRNVSFICPSVTEFLIVAMFDMSQLLLLGKFEYGGGPIFKVVLEC